MGLLNYPSNQRPRITLIDRGREKIWSKKSKWEITRENALTEWSRATLKAAHQEFAASAVHLCNCFRGPSASVRELPLHQLKINLIICRKISGFSIFVTAPSCSALIRSVFPQPLLLNCGCSQPQRNDQRNASRAGKAEIHFPCALNRTWLRLDHAGRDNFLLTYFWNVVTKLPKWANYLIFDNNNIKGHLKVGLEILQIAAFLICRVVSTPSCFALVGSVLPQPLLLNYGSGWPQRKVKRNRRGGKAKIGFPVP